MCTRRRAGKALWWVIAICAVGLGLGNLCDSPVVSPDGVLVACPVFTGTRGRQFVIAGISGKRARCAITPAGRLCGAYAWFPEGRRFATVSTVDFRGRPVLVWEVWDCEKGKRVSMVQAPARETPVAASVGSSGHILAVAETVGGPFGIPVPTARFALRVIDDRGKEELHCDLTNGPSLGFFPQRAFWFDEACGRVLFGGQRELWAFNIPSKQATRLLGPEAVSALTLYLRISHTRAPAGVSLVVPGKQEANGMYPFYQLDPGATAIRVVARCPQSGLAAAWAGQPLRILFWQRAGWTTSLSAWDTATGTTQQGQVTTRGAPVALLPDGKRVLFWGETSVFLVDLASGKEDLLVDALSDPLG